MTAPAAPIILVTTGHPTLHQHPGPAGEPVHPRLGRLLQPRHLSSVELTAEAGIPWACDNDCFQGLDERAFVKMIDRVTGLRGCLFVTVPDVVADAPATLASFERWAPELERRGLPLALVAQDGMTVAELVDRAPRLAALFIGGSTEWKEGPDAAELAVAAKRLGLWVHWGRVNTRRRFDLIVATGAADSFDGSKWARFRKTYLPGGLLWLDEAAAARRAALAGGDTLDPQEQPRMTVPRTSAREIRDLAARVAILDKFDTYRSRGRFDMTASRRQSTLRRLEEELHRAREARRLDLLVKPDDVDLADARGLLEPRPDDLAAAFARECSARIGRSVSDGVLTALERVRVELNLPRPRKLDRALNGDGSIEVYASGGSRQRRRRRATRVR